MSITQNFSEKSLIDYGEHFYKVDEWMIRGSQTVQGTSFGGSELISRDDFERSECYADYGRFLGLYDTVASVFETSTGLCAFGVHRDKEDNSFDEKDRFLFNLIIPHIYKINSIELHSKFSTQACVNGLLFETLSQKGSSVILVDAFLNVKYINSAAERLLSKCESLGILHGKLRARSDQIDGVILASVKAIVNVAVAPAKEIRIPGFNGGPAIALKVAASAWRKIC